MAQQPFWNVLVYADDSKAQLLSTITMVTKYYRKRTLDAPDDIQLTLLLTDPNTAALKKHLYVEIWAGRTQPRVFYGGGRVQNITRSVSRNNEFVVSLAGALIGLSDFTSTGALVMPVGDFPTVREVLGGINAPGQPALPGQKGILTPTGWTVGNWVDDISGTSWPKTGGDLRSDWYNVLGDVQQLAHDYHFHVRPQPQSTGSSGVLDCGQFGDSSGLIVWGGNPLLEQLIKNYPGLEQPNAALAQRQGMAVIEGPQYVDNLSKVANIVWPSGHGSYHSQVTLRTIFGSIDLTKTYQPRPGGRVYYLGPSYTVSDLGRTTTYTLVAAEQQDTTRNNPWNWAYGLMNQTSVESYGPHEFVHHDHTIFDANTLLQTALGFVDQHSDPIPSIILPVKHPRTSASGVPLQVLPGQSIDVRYQGTVSAVEFNSSGQLVPTNSTYVYLDWPHKDDPTYPQMSRCFQVEEEWANHQFTATYTMGRGTTKPQHYYEILAKKITHHEHAPSRRSFIQQNLNGFPWLLSTSPLAKENAAGNALTLSPGATAVLDIPHPDIFRDHKRVVWTISLSDPLTYLDFWFGKPVNGAIDNPNAGVPYGVARLAMPQSGQACGFFTTSDGVTYTRRGSLPNKKLFHSGLTLTPGNYTVEIGWSGSANASGVYTSAVYEMWVTREHHGAQPWLLARWHDNIIGSGTTMAGYGTIGFKSHGGQNTLNISNISVHHHPKKGVASVGGGGIGGYHTQATSETGPGVPETAISHKTVDMTSGVSLTHHVLSDSGHHTSRGPLRHSVPQPATVTVSSVTSLGGSLYQIALIVDRHLPLTLGGIQPGWLLELADGSNTTLTVGPASSIISDATGHTTGVKDAIISFTSSSPGAASVVAGTVLSIDHLAHPHPTASEIGGYHDVSGSHGKVATFGVSGGKKTLGLTETGQLLLGDQLLQDALTNPTGAPGQRPATPPIPSGVNSLSAGAAGGAALARGLAAQGATLFDAAEFSDPNAQAVPYLVDTSGNVTVGATIGPGPIGGMTQPGVSPGSAYQALWVRSTAIGAPTNGQGDYFLALTTVPDSTHASAVRWSSVALTDETGLKRTLAVRHDTDFAFPVWIGPSGTSILTIGGECSLVGDYAAGSTTFTLNASPTTAGMAASQTWTLGAGTGDIETLTIASINDSAKTVTFTAGSVNQHQDGSVVRQVTTATGAAVSAPIPLDTLTAVGDQIPNVDAISLELYDTFGNVWGAYWSSSSAIDMPWSATKSAPRTTLTAAVNAGDTSCVVASTTGIIGSQPGQVIQVDRGGAYEEMIVSSVSGSTITFQNMFTQAHASGATVFTRLPMKHMGQLPAKSAAQWITLTAKASDMKMGLGQLPLITVSGMALGIYTRAGGTPVTIYFDAHSHGFAPSAEAVNSALSDLGQGVTWGRTLPTQNPSTRHSLDTYGWIHGNQLYWTSGALAGHGDKTYTINGANDQATPNTGISALLSGQTSPAGNYIVFNSGSTSVTITDINGVTTTIPAYSQSGGAGGQSTGFGVLSSQFDWTRRPGPSSGYSGPPSQLWRIGQVHNSPDPVTGDYQIDGEFGYLTAVAYRLGSLAPGHLSYANPTRGHFVGGAFSVNVISSAPYFIFTPVASSDTGQSLQFATDDGSGDTYSALGFTITGPGRPFTPGNPLNQGVLIGPSGGNYRATFPSGGAAGSLLTFCHLFPAPPSNVVVGSSGSLATGTYDVSITFTRTITTSTGSQFVESPLSLKASASVTGPTGSFTCTVPAPPNGWVTSVYLAQSGSPTLQTTSQYSLSGTTLTVTGMSATGPTPSFGFMAWPPKSDIVGKPGSGSEYVMKLGHVGTTVDTVTNTYPLLGFHAGAIQHQNNGMAPGSISGGQSVNNVTLTNHFAGGIVNATTAFRSQQTTGPWAAPQTALGSGATASVTGTDTSGTVTMTSGASGQAAGVAVAVGFNQSHSGTPIVSLTPTSGNLAGLQPYVSAQNATGFNVSLNLAPAASTTYTFNYHVLWI